MTGWSKGYTGRDYGSHQRQVREHEELCGLGEDHSVEAEFEDDNQADLEAERTRRPIAPSMPRVLRLHRIDTTNEKRAA